MYLVTPTSAPRSKGMPASQQVRLGRKRPLPSCPNPLFLQWLTELRDDAKEKGLKLQYVYQKVRHQSKVLGSWYVMSLFTVRFYSYSK